VCASKFNISDNYQHFLLWWSLLRHAGVILYKVSLLYLSISCRYRGSLSYIKFPYRNPTRSRVFGVLFVLLTLRLESISSSTHLIYICICKMQTPSYTQNFEAFFARLGSVRIAYHISHVLSKRYGDYDEKFIFLFENTRNGNSMCNPL